MKFIPKLWAENADQKHVNNRSRLVSAPGGNYYNGCQTSNVWRRNMSRSRERRPRGSRKQQTKITFAARTRTLNRFKKIIRGIRSLDSFSRVLTLSMKFSVDCSLCLDSSVRGFSTLVKYLDPVHTKTIVNANASKRKLFYAFRPSVHTKTMKTLTVNA